MKWLALALLLGACGDTGKGLVVRVSAIPPGTLSLEADVAAGQHEATHRFDSPAAVAALATGAASFAVTAPDGDQTVTVLVEANGADCVLARGTGSCAADCASVTVALTPTGPCRVPDAGGLDDGRGDAGADPP